MRRIIVLLFLLPCVLFSLDHGLITGFETRFNIADRVLMKDVINDNEIYKSYDNSLSVLIEIGYRIEGFRIMGTLQNTFKPLDWDSFLPLQDRYTIDINYSFNNFIIGFTHFCDHPVNALNTNNKTLKDEGHRFIYIKYYKEF